MLIPSTLALAIWVGWPPAPPTLADLEFVMAVEESVMAEPGTTPPEPYRGLIDLQGSDCYRCREIASRRLASTVVIGRWSVVENDRGANSIGGRWATDDGMRWLFWGRKHRDPEVRLRSNAILRRLNPCPSCGGSGASRHYREDPCWDCRGLGSAWPWSALD